MNHVSNKWLRKLRVLFLIYCAQFVVIYLYLGIAHHDWTGTKYFPLALIGLLAIQAFYEIFSSIKIVKRWPYAATWISLNFLIFETAAIFNPTGVYYSPYIAAFFVVAFISGMLGWVFPMMLSSLMTIFYVFGLAGFLTTPLDVTQRFKLTGLIEVLAVAILSLFGYLFWERYYDIPDNDQLKRLNARLRSRAQQTSSVLNSIGDGVIVFDGKGLVDLINPPASAMIGWDVKEALGVDIHKILKYTNPDPKAPDTAMKDLFEIAISEKKHLTETVKLESPKVHHNIIVSLGISPIIIPPNNELVGGVAILHDITEEQDIERQLTDFISTASHEMRTPLATIEGYLDLALTDKKNPLKEPVREYIESAHKSTAHLGKLFQDLLSSSRAEDGNLANSPEVIDLREFLELFKDDFKYTTGKYGLGFDYSVGGNSENDSLTSGVHHLIKPKYYVYADPERLRELITNLFDNAIKFTQEGKICIGVNGYKDSIQLYVKDTGVGIPREDIRHLFQKFYRVDNSPTRTTGGTGLGLFICRKVVELYGGRIWVESTLGKGSTFYVSLPRMTDSQARELKISKPKQSQTREKPINSSTDSASIVSS